MSDTVKDENNNDSDKGANKISVFGNIQPLFSNNYHTFIVRKSERLASALYVITGFMPGEEPVRSRLRVCALELITRSSSPQELTATGKEIFEARCAEIVAILKTAHYAGLISEMNAKMIGEEYATLAAFVRSNSSKITERGNELEKASVSDPKTPSSPIRHNGPRLLKSETSLKRTLTNNKNGNLSSRKNTILNILNTKMEISIKDAVSFIPGVSEKTVQRDLLGLVAAGVLVKKGSRRWTTYSKSIPSTPS